jgi:hypothetical protein
MILTGGVEITVAELKRGLPKFGVFSLSSMVMTCIFAALKPPKPKRVGFSTLMLGHVLTRDSKLLALALGRYARLPLLGALCFL